MEKLNGAKGGIASKIMSSDKGGEGELPTVVHRSIK